jgi:hypothetical protein
MAEGKWGNPPWPVWALVTVLVAAVPVLLNRSPDKSAESSSAESDVSGQTAVPDLTSGTWTLRRAVDDSGSYWSNTTLKFTSQDATAGGLILTGAFNWRLDNEFKGKERFTGRYLTANRLIILEGIQIDEYDSTGGHMATGNYSARVSPDNRSLVDGTWGSTERDTAMPTLPGRWEATR